MANDARKLFVNLPVRDLKRSMAYFRELGFEFNAKFTNDQAAAMLINDDAWVMLLTVPFFQTFTKREVCDTAVSTEVLLCISAPSRVAVDELVARAVAAGGKPAQDEPQDHGFMYGSSFYDLDGHGWEVMWMDPAAV